MYDAGPGGVRHRRRQIGWEAEECRGGGFHVSGPDGTGNGDPDREQ